MKISKMFNLKTVSTKVGSDDAAKPLCPTCGKSVDTIVSHRSDYVGLANLHVFACPHCRNILGVTTVMK